MTLISTILINQASPYNVQIIDDGFSLGFTTDCNISYKIAFTEDSSIYEKDAFMFYIGAEDKPLGRDCKIADTIYAILNSFFEDKRRILLYFCDMKDHRQALRDRLFNIWYENYPDNNLFRKITIAIEVETEMYFVSLIVSEFHPEIETICNQFELYLNELKSK